MKWQPSDILSILDQCCDSYTFPMLDNGYVYLAAPRLSLYRSELHWALVIEVFGFMPRAGIPDNSIHTFSDSLHNRKHEADFVNRSAFESYLATNPNNEFSSIYPIETGDWQDESGEEVASSEHSIMLRGTKYRLPALAEYLQHEVSLENPSQAKVFELCRFLAATNREDVLANADERRINVQPEMSQILQLEEWNHPNVVDENARPSGSETFQQLAKVLATGNLEHYKPTLQPNTHWKNWPDGGTL